MSEQRVMDEWGRLEVEWKAAVDAALSRQREYDTKMTNHLVYHFAAPALDELAEIAELWNTAIEKRRAANEFIRNQAGAAD